MNKMVTRQPKVYIITINHNKDQDTKEFVESLKQSVYKNFSVLIVDNSVNESSPEALKKYLVNEDLRTYITTEDNIDVNKLKEAPFSFIRAANNGFAAANNLIIRSLIDNLIISDEDYAWIINNDVIVDKDSLQLLIESYEQQIHENIGIIAPVIYYHNSTTIWSAGGYFIKQLGMIVSYDKGKQIAGEIIKRINFLTGCAWLIRMDRLRKVGLMDESFFMYGEDVDYSLKVIGRNLKLVIHPKAFIWHKVGSSSNGDMSSFSAYWMMFGRIRNIRKHGGFIGKYIALFVVFLSRLIVFPYYLAKNKGYLIGCQVRAIVNGLVTR